MPMAQGLHGWLGRIVGSGVVGEIVERLGGGGDVSVEGVWGSSTNLLVGALAARLGRPVLYVTAHLDDSDDAYEDLGLFEEAGYSIWRERFGAMEVLPGETNVSLELLAERLAVVEKLVKGVGVGGGQWSMNSPESRVKSPESGVQSSEYADRIVEKQKEGGKKNGHDGGNDDGLGLYGGGAMVLVASIAALMQPVPEAGALGEFALSLEVGKEMAPGRLFDWLDRAGYSRVDVIEQPGDFTSRGGIVDIYLPSSGGTGGEGNVPTAVRLDYFGDEIESISVIDPATMGSGRKVERVQVVGASVERLDSEERSTNLVKLLPGGTVVVLSEVLELAEQSRGYYERLTKGRGVYSPGEVMKLLTERQHVEVNQFGGVIQSPGSRVQGPESKVKSPESRVRGQESKKGEHARFGASVDRKRGDEGSSDNPDRFLTPPEVAARRSEGRGSLEQSLRMPVGALPGFSHDARAATKELIELAGSGDGARVRVICQHEAEAKRLRELIAEQGGAVGKEGGISLEVGYLHRGFVWEECGTEGTEYLIPHHELFHRYLTRRRIRRVGGGATASGKATDAFIDLNEGDYVVHADHGIARFVGLRTMRSKKGDGGEGSRCGSEDYLTLEFSGNALLHVPASQIELVEKYIGGFAGRPPLSVLGGKRWAKQKEQVAEAVKDLAAEMLRLQAARASLPGVRYPADTAWQKEFEAEFPYEETEDQLAAIAAVKKDMGDDQPMDRLICGDVGFGKTEVAIRAAFKAVEFGKQVAVLVPTTVLAEQHERTFRDRMADYPFRIASLSRFKTHGEQAEVLKLLADGKVDIVIGTHRLLSVDVKFADLGLVIVDEEQRFGVEHKQRLLAFRMTADVLTLTATPIPRTLHMSLLGLRDISSLSTPPMDRRAIVTEVMPFERERIKRAIAREMNRDGQVYFVHNRVHDIHAVAEEVRKLAGGGRVVVGHGQMGAHELEEVMLTFMRREADILVCTTIIESGIDIPTVNTIFIDEADIYGLADLHQLRGRVGRYKHRAYCYLLLPEERVLTEKAGKRLKAIEQYSMLGAGFRIAMRDLEIRGAGNLLGAEQSGHIAAVGYQMYCTLLENEARKLRKQEGSVVEQARTHLELPVAGRVPASYIGNDKYRLEAYRRISRAGTRGELEAVGKDLEDAYGELPGEVRALLDLAELRIGASGLGVASIKLDGPDLIFKTNQPQRLEGVLKKAAGRASLIDERTIYYRPPAGYLEPGTLVAVLRKMLVGREEVGGQ